MKLQESRLKLLNEVETSFDDIIPSLPEYSKLLQEKIEKECQRLELKIKELESCFSEESDNLYQFLVTKFKDRIGLAYSTDRLLKLCEIGSSRYANQIPPGFKDVGKSGIEKFGDFFVWSQILDHFRTSPSAGCIFVSDDQKEDWVDKKTRIGY